MRTVTIGEPQEWIFVDIVGVPSAKQRKLMQTFPMLKGAQDGGLLQDGKTVYVLVKASENTREGIEEYLARRFRSLELRGIEISFSEAWSMEVTQRPFAEEESEQAKLEAKFPNSIKEVDWYSGEDELTLWTERWPSPRLRREVKAILSS